MSDEPTPDPEPQGQQASLAEPGGSKTRYMVLWAPIPEDEENELRWREIGWYEAHDGLRARQSAADDQDSGHHGQIVDAAKSRGLKMRSVPERSWPDDVEPIGVVQPPPVLEIK